MAELQNEGPDPLALLRGGPPVTVVEYRAWAGEDHMLTVTCLTPFGIRGESGDATRPWTA
ncbi:hypothetical protein [Amycolatopsis sp. NPDC004079]|uniref:hypothetical protein n=1 Tax=Amycolatopsis sp. NPDC004079 TaxID=3154549 RepID=UPI0033A6D727